MRRGLLSLIAALSVPVVLAGTTGTALAQPYEVNDSHFHLTNYIQRGTDIHKFLEIMGDKVGRVALFGIPLQQTWSHENSGDFAPTYYLQTDAPLYYYSFTDAYIAMTYKSLTQQQQARFDPMITGFNPADMYGVDHIRRVLETFPGVFTGIGEFSIHKEFVSSKVAGDTASLTDPALDRILDFAAESGLLVLIHNDIDMPFAKQGAEPVYLTQMKDLLRRHPNATIVWAHMGLGRVIRPVETSASAETTERSPEHVGVVAEMLADPTLAHVSFDISWDEVAKYIVATPDSVKRSAAVINKYPDRFLFGTDEVAPQDQQGYLKVYRQYDPLWKALTPDARDKVKRLNYERLFDAARTKVRAWERANVH
ncbi:MAG TPA: amidohydrolase family protein [Gammaproteobacteria bacterium]|nr:amidohydrolase family protein [Gammaproteobacteria bacterium]